MFSVFSNTKKPSEIIRELSLCAGSNLNRLLFSGPEDEPLYILKPEVLNYPVNKEGLNIIEWANKNILYDEKNKGNDPFWENTSADYFAGLALALFEDVSGI